MFWSQPRLDSSMAGLNARIKVDGVPAFWDQLERSAHTILLLDYDGTLAPFHEERMQARPLPGIVEAIERLGKVGNTTIALVSGRPVAEVRELTGLSSVIIAGTHGFELYSPVSGTAAIDIEPAVAQTLERVHAEAARLVGAARAERKIATVALHVRGLDERDARDAMLAFRDVASTASAADFEVRDFNGGVELRARHRDKGVAVREILAALPSADLVVYVGDDDTDEDAFRALRDIDGVGIRVGAPDLSTSAQGRLESCDDVLSLLTDWIATKTCQ
jgi:trehalose-phosphatase